MPVTFVLSLFSLSLAPICAESQSQDQAENIPEPKKPEPVLSTPAHTPVATPCRSDIETPKDWQNILSKHTVNFPLNYCICTICVFGAVSYLACRWEFLTMIGS